MLTVPSSVFYSCDMRDTTRLPPATSNHILNAMNSAILIRTILALFTLYTLSATAKLTSAACSRGLCLQMRVQADGKWPLRLYPDADIPNPPACGNPDLSATLYRHVFNNEHGREIAYYHLDRGSYLGGPFNFDVPHGSTRIAACATGLLRKREAYTTCWVARENNDFGHSDINGGRCDLAYGWSARTRWDAHDNVVPTFGVLDWVLTVITLLEIPLNVLQLVSIVIRLSQKRDSEQNGMDDNDDARSRSLSEPTRTVSSDCSTGAMGPLTYGRRPTVLDLAVDIASSCAKHCSILRTVTPSRVPSRLEPVTAFLQRGDAPEQRGQNYDAGLADQSSRRDLHDGYDNFLISNTPVIPKGAVAPATAENIDDSNKPQASSMDFNEHGDQEVKLKPSINLHVERDRNAEGSATTTVEHSEVALPTPPSVE